MADINGPSASLHTRRPWSLPIYALLGLLGVKPLIGFRWRGKPSRRGKPEALKLRFRKMVEAGMHAVDRLKAPGLSADSEENIIDEILLGLALARQNKYIGAYYRNMSPKEFRLDDEAWLKHNAQFHNLVEGSHGQQKDRLALDDLGAVAYAEQWSTRC